MVQSEVGSEGKEKKEERGKTFATCFYGHPAENWSSRETTEKLDIGTEKLIIEIHF